MLVVSSTCFPPVVSVHNLARLRYKQNHAGRCVRPLCVICSDHHLCMVMGRVTTCWVVASNLPHSVVFNTFARSWFKHLLTTLAQSCYKYHYALLLQAASLFFGALLVVASRFPTPPVVRALDGPCTEIIMLRSWLLHQALILLLCCSHCSCVVVMRPMSCFLDASNLPPPL